MTGVEGLGGVLGAFDVGYDSATKQQGDIARYRGLQALSQYMMQPQMGGGMPPQGPQAIPQPQGGPPMGGPPMGGQPPMQGGPPMGGAPGGGLPPPSGPPGMPPGGGTQPPMGGEFQTPGQGPLTWQQAVQAIQRANPGAPPNVLAAAVDGMIPLMTADSQQQYRQMREQIMMLMAQQKPQIVQMQEVGKDRRVGMQQEGAGQRAQLSADTKTDIAQDAEEGRMARAQLSADTRTDLAKLSRDAKMEIENLRQEGALVRANLSAETRKEIAQLSDKTRRELFHEGEEGKDRRSAIGLKQEQHVQDVESVITQIDSALKSIDESQHGGAPVTGIGGTVERMYEFGANTLGMDDKTSASDFQTKIRLIQSQLPRALLNVGKIGKDEREHLDDVVRGLGRFTSATGAKSALEYVKSVLQSKMQQGGQPQVKPGGGQPKQQGAPMEKVINGKTYYQGEDGNVYEKKLNDKRSMSDEQPDAIRGGQQYAQARPPLQIQPRGDGKYAVINPATGQTVYVGSLDGARNAQANGIAQIRRSMD